MALTPQEILNAIRDNATELYAERVPEATDENLAQVGQAITAEENIMNEFVTSLVNKVALTNIRSKFYKNPLAILKSAGVPLGNTIEELFVNPATDTGYDNDQKKLLKTTKPDGKTAYYGLNRKAQYPVTINEAELSRAFTNALAFMSFYNAIVVSLYSGDNIDEFMLMKKVVAKAVDTGAIQTVACKMSEPKNIAKAISNISKKFTFPSTNFAGYNLVNADAIEGETDTKCVTFCPLDRQVLLLRSDVETEISYEVLATMFHLELAEIKAMTILVDDFPTDTDVLAVLCDVDCLQFRDMMFKMTSQYIGNTLEWNFWLNHWQFLFLSMFGNAVAFINTDSESGNDSGNENGNDTP